MNSEFARFLLSGAIAAGFNFGSRILFSLWMPFVPAVVLAFFVGLTTAFLLNRAMVFAKSGKHWTNEAIWFFVINLFGLAQTVFVSWWLLRYLLPAIGQTLWVEETAHAAGVVTPIVTSYFGHKHVTFGKHR